MYPQHRISVARYEKEAQVMEVLLLTGLNMCFGSSCELSHRDGSFCLFDLFLYVHSTIFQLCGTVLPGFNQY